MVAGPRGTVLLVEDDDSMRKAIERLLEEGGYDCAAYKTAEPLLAECVDEQSVCLISDLKLPGMSGLDLLAALRAKGISLPFILITGHDAPGLRQEAMGRGATAYLAKPFRGKSLLEAVGAAVERRPQA